MLPLIACFSLTGCTLEGFDWNINDGFDTDEYIPPDYDFTITSDMDNIYVSASNIGEYGETATLVALNPYEYLNGEDTTGLSNDLNASPKIIDTYECGTEQNLVFDRFFEDGTDGIYLKYYFLSDADEILAGPMHCTSFEPLYTHDDPIQLKSIKGVMCDDAYRSEIADLGCSYVYVNFVITNLFVPNEIYNSETGLIEQLQYVEQVDSDGNMTITQQNGKTYKVDYIDYNGKRYYFRMDVTNSGHSLRGYDSMIKKYSNDGVKVTLIVLMYLEKDQYMQPYFLKYPAIADSNTNKYIQFNTSNQYGAGYWGALMEFLGKRYSEEDGSGNSKFGVVQDYVIGNEIDMSSSWNNIVAPGQAALSLENYLEEYDREMRIANTALKKYSSLNQVFLPITHMWTNKFEEYYPKDILDNLTIKTKLEGDYDYGFALHPYGYNLLDPEFWKGDTSTSSMNGSLNTGAITWSNLEVMQLYLEQPSKLYNGQVRSVLLTEGGVASSSINDKDMFEKTKNQQAAGIAYLYYKSTQLSCVKALIYYRLIDNSGDGAYFGLIGENGRNKKPAYTVYKYIDTQFSFDVSAPYLKYIEWSVTIGGKVYSFGQEIGNVNSYYDTMALFNSRFDWSTHWNEDLIIRRTIDPDDYVV